MPLNIERLEFFPPPITSVHIVITTMNKTVFIPYISLLEKILSNPLQSFYFQ